jgi:predicted nucleic acid-binding protein
MTSSWSYIDTSAYLQLFIKGSGSDKARKIARDCRLLSSTIIVVECFSALARKKREGELPEEVFRKALKAVKGGFRSLEIVNINDAVLKRTKDIALHSSYRSLDALHISSALLFQESTDIELTFITSDKIQRDAATNSGLRVVFIE